MSERDDRKEYRDWQRRLALRLPDLAARTFALRGRSYPGSGYHYALERQLGGVIRIASSYDNAPDVGERVINEVLVEGFHKDLMAAEKGAIA